MPSGIEDVAARAGVSTATVSRALRGLPNVAEPTRERVLAAARELDYVISPTASRLATGRTRAVGVVTPYIDRWFFGQVVSGVESALRAAGMDLLLYVLPDETVRHRFFEDLPLRRRVDGVLVLTLPLVRAEVDALRALDVPVAFVGASVPGCSSVRIDDVAGARLAVQHLVNLGHRRIGMIGGGYEPSAHFTTPDDRRDGYRAALREAGLAVDPALEIEGGYTVGGGEQAMAELLALPEPPTAVFAQSDEMAMGALRALRRAGLECPGDVSVVGLRQPRDGRAPGDHDRGPARGRAGHDRRGVGARHPRPGGGAGRRDGRHPPGAARVDLPAAGGPRRPPRRPAAGRAGGAGRAGRAGRRGRPGGRGHRRRDAAATYRSEGEPVTAVAVLGERVVDLVPEGDGLLRPLPGGSPTNVALGLARLGIEPVLLARSGGDGFSRLLDQHLRDNGLSTDGVVHAGGPSALAVVDKQPDGSARYDLYLEAVPDLAWTAPDLSTALAAARAHGAIAWHTGSLASWAGPGAREVLAAFAAARDAGSMALSYDPNARPGVEDPGLVVERVLRYVAVADVVKVSDEDLATLFPHRDAEEVCAAWAGSGTGLVVLTRGADGVSAWRHGRPRLDVPGVKVDVVDTVGAGDTLSAALLAGLAEAGALRPTAEGALAALPEERLEEILGRACVAAALTCSRAGADLPTRAEVDAFVA